MIRFIEGVTGVSQFDTQRMPPAAAARLNEYDRPPTTPLGTAATLGHGYQLAETYPFQREVLGKLVAKQSQDAYWSSRKGKEYLPSALASAADTGVVETSERTASFVAPDLAAAKGAGTDLSVFGIRLGELLSLPDCPPSSSDDMLFEAFNVSTVASTCVVKSAGTLTQVFAQLAAVGSTVPWTSSGLSIKLAHAACPDWVTSGCLVVLNMQNGIPLGAFFTTSGVEQTHKIEGLLVNKYHRPSARGQPLQCENNLTGALAENSYERHWQLPGLYVSYAPITMCPTSTIVTTGGAYAARSTVQRGGTEGKVTIELSQFRDQKNKVGEQRQQRHEDTQPKL
jgi:hypothetical protein